MCKGTRNVRIFGIAAVIGTGDSQIEKCDATASPNTDSPFETGDSDVDPNYSLSDYSYSDSSDRNSLDSNSSDSNSSLLHEVNYSVLNEPQNLDLTSERKQEPKSRERKRTLQ
jgi:hypothetical protein